MRLDKMYVGNSNLFWCYSISPFSKAFYKWLQRKFLIIPVTVYIILISWDQKLYFVCDASGWVENKNSII